MIRTCLRLEEAQQACEGRIEVEVEVSKKEYSPRCTAAKWSFCRGHGRISNGEVQYSTKLASFGLWRPEMHCGEVPTAPEGRQHFQ
jgi:hypothetical protein